MRQRWLFTENHEVFVLGQRSSLRKKDFSKGRRPVLSLMMVLMVIFIMVLMVLMVMMVPMVIFIVIIIIVAKTSSPCTQFDDDVAVGDIYHHHRHHDCGKNFVTLYSV